MRGVLRTAIEAAAKSLGLGKTEFVVEHPVEMKHGDYATNVAMVGFKKVENKFKSPRELAEEIAEKLKTEESLKKIAEKIRVEGPGFINISIKNEALINLTGRLLKGEIDKSYQGKKYLIEHTSPNPNKAMHLGHLRNNITGMAIANIYEFLGCEVVRDCIDNNRGIAIAKLMWGYLKFGHKQKKPVTDIDYWYEHQTEWQTPEDLKIRPDKFIDELYVKGSEEAKDPEAEKQIKQLVIDWEAKDKKNWALWKRVLEYAYKGQELTLERLGNKWDKVWHEHEHYQAGKDLVEKGLKMGVFKKGKQGAIVTDLRKYKIPDTVVIKADGTALYITQDLALTKLKKETFKPDRLFWVIGPEQSLALKQMFAACEQLGIVKYEDCVHVAYGYMSIKGKGKMSSRQGTVVYIDDLLDEAKKRILKEHKVGQEAAEVIGVGAVKYSILKTGRLKDTAFDFKESINFEGNSGPYLQYTYARCKSVLAKAGKEKVELKRVEGVNKEEGLVLRTVYRFPEVVAEAAKELAPNLVANFLYDLAQKYNSFYNKQPILKAEKGKRELRLWLTTVTAKVIKDGLYLLGIEAPERM